MANMEWSIHGKEYANCNCAYGCPCQFNALPTTGNCEAANGFVIEDGHYGDVSLGGLRAAGVYHWPGPVHLGNGTMQLIIDERANSKQRDSLIKIMSGQDTDDMATMWWVYAAMCPTKLEPLFLPITLDMDLESRTGRMMIAGLLDSAVEPIRNPVTGAEHRARIDLPHGFEYRVAEAASGRTKATGAIKLDLVNTHAHFCSIHLSNKGIVDKIAA